MNSNSPAIDDPESGRVLIALPKGVPVYWSLQIALFSVAEAALFSLVGFMVVYGIYWVNALAYNWPILTLATGVLTINLFLLGLLIVFVTMGFVPWLQQRFHRTSSESGD